MSECVVVGIGASSAATVLECLELVGSLVRSSWTVSAVATIEAKRTLGGSVADALGVRCSVFTADELASIVVPDPSSRVRAAVGVSSVAEAAAIRGSGGGPLVVGKTSRRGVTVAIACQAD
ncbi:cobalamin biosynthesis protein [Rhodococcus sp. G-MC3]|uniref:cobalamin biosynthesis protein n=1 Tax=Rhodococcus sp. G-MC3 TaxID=3046209 RepID=UPI0024B91681|nr:cobalamin biosynthesis protein [Rhodococcus sp. G-MC3]MDJ0391883.1 cobalamin biosynthesis protein [Rhodococcus sp. G-MC3]